MRLKCKFEMTIWKILSLENSFCSCYDQNMVNNKIVIYVFLSYHNNSRYTIILYTYITIANIIQLQWKNMILLPNSFYRFIIIFVFLKKYVFICTFITIITFRYNIISPICIYCFYIVVYVTGKTWPSYISTCTQTIERLMI